MLETGSMGMSAGRDVEATLAAGGRDEVVMAVLSVAVVGGPKVGLAGAFRVLCSSSAVTPFADSLELDTIKDSSALAADMVVCADTENSGIRIQAYMEAAQNLFNHFHS